MLCEATSAAQESSNLKVLILVLMEDALRAHQEPQSRRRLYGVLILVLMEDALRVYSLYLDTYANGLNPCSNGRCSARGGRGRHNQSLQVLILVLMEDALRDLNDYFLKVRDLF